MADVLDSSETVKEIEGAELVRGYQAREPEIAFDGTLELRVGDVDVTLFGVPGHVPMETAVYVPADRLLFTSDNVFHDTMIWYQEALPFQWLETLDRFKRMDVKTIVPGHGEATGPQVLDTMRRDIEESLAQVQAAIERGVTRDEAMDRMTFIHQRSVPALHRAPALQRLFVGRLFDEIQARRGSR